VRLLLLYFGSKIKTLTPNDDTDTKKHLMISPMMNYQTSQKKIPSIGNNQFGTWNHHLILMVINCRQCRLFVLILLITNCRKSRLFIFGC
jgi:hypothetical protein